METTQAPRNGASPSEGKFVVTEDHLKLARKMWVDWQDCETGAPEVNPKRPYGNSNVAQDVADALGIEYEGDDEQDNMLMAKHYEMLNVVSLLLRHGQLPLGEYEFTDRYKWEYQG